MFQDKGIKGFEIADCGLIKGARPKVQGARRNAEKTRIIPCTLYLIPQLLSTGFFDCGLPGRPFVAGN